MEKLKYLLPVIITSLLSGIFTLLLVAVVYFGVFMSFSTKVESMAVETQNNAQSIIKIAEFINQNIKK